MWVKRVRELRLEATNVKRSVPTAVLVEAAAHEYHEANIRCETLSFLICPCLTPFRHLLTS